MATKQLRISASVEITDILMAELSEIGFDIFEEKFYSGYCKFSIVSKISPVEFPKGKFDEKSPMHCMLW